QLARLDFDGVEVGNAAGEFGAVQIADTDDVTSRKIAFAPCYAGRQQAFAILAQGFSSSVVHKQCAFRVMKEGYPSFASLQFAGLWHEQGSLIIACEYSSQRTFLFSGRNDQRNSRTNSNFRSLNFRGHSANSGGAVGSAG